MSNETYDLVLDAVEEANMRGGVTEDQKRRLIRKISGMSLSAAATPANSFRPSPSSARPTASGAGPSASSNPPWMRGDYARTRSGGAVAAAAQALAMAQQEQDDADAEAEEVSSGLAEYAAQRAADQRAAQRAADQRAQLSYQRAPVSSGGRATSSGGFPRAEAPLCGCILKTGARAGLGCTNPGKPELGGRCGIHR